VPRLLNEIGLGSDVAAVVTGAGVDADIWARMRRTVLRYERRGDVGLFVPTLKQEEEA